MNLKRIIHGALPVLALLVSGDGICANGEISGKIKKLRTHQYLNNEGWDKKTWFCLDVNTTVGTCGIPSICDGNPIFVISEESHSEVFSIVLAAKMAKSRIKVQVNDSIKYEDYCMANWIEIE